MSQTGFTQGNLLSVDKYHSEGETKSETINDFSQYSDCGEIKVTNLNSQESIGAQDPNVKIPIKVEYTYPNLNNGTSHLSPIDTGSSNDSEEEEDNSKFEITKKKTIRKIISRTTSINGIEKENEVQEFLIKDSHVNDPLSDGRKNSRRGSRGSDKKKNKMHRDVSMKQKPQKNFKDENGVDENKCLSSGNIDLSERSRCFSSDEDIDENMIFKKGSNNNKERGTKSRSNKSGKRKKMGLANNALQEKPSMVLEQNNILEEGYEDLGEITVIYSDRTDISDNMQHSFTVEKDTDEDMVSVKTRNHGEERWRKKVAEVPTKTKGIEPQNNSLPQIWFMDLNETNHLLLSNEGSGEMNVIGSDRTDFENVSFSLTSENNIDQDIIFSKDFIKNKDDGMKAVSYGSTEKKNKHEDMVSSTNKPFKDSDGNPRFLSELGKGKDAFDKNKVETSYHKDVLGNTSLSSTPDKDIEQKTIFTKVDKDNEEPFSKILATESMKIKNTDSKINALQNEPSKDSSMIQEEDTEEEVITDKESEKILESFGSMESKERVSLYVSSEDKLSKDFGNDCQFGSVLEKCKDILDNNKCLNSTNMDLSEKPTNFFTLEENMEEDTIFANRARNNKEGKQKLIKEESILKENNAHLNDNGRNESFLNFQKNINSKEGDEIDTIFLDRKVSSENTQRLVTSEPIFKDETINTKRENKKQEKKVRKKSNGSIVRDLDNTYDSPSHLENAKDGFHLNNVLGFDCMPLSENLPYLVFSKNKFEENRENNQKPRYKTGTDGSFKNKNIEHRKDGFPHKSTMDSDHNIDSEEGKDDFDERNEKDSDHKNNFGKPQDWFILENDIVEEKTVEKLVNEDKDGGIQKACYDSTKNKDTDYSNILSKDRYSYDNCYFPSDLDKRNDESSNQQPMLASEKDIIEDTIIAKSRKRNNDPWQKIEDKESITKTNTGNNNNTFQDKSTVNMDDNNLSDEGEESPRELKVKYSNHPKYLKNKSHLNTFERDFDEDRIFAKVPIKESKTQTHSKGFFEKKKGSCREKSYRDFDDDNNSQRNLEKSYDTFPNNQNMGSDRMGLSVSPSYSLDFDTDVEEHVTFPQNEKYDKEGGLDIATDGKIKNKNVVHRNDNKSSLRSSRGSVSSEKDIDLNSIFEKETKKDQERKYDWSGSSGDKLYKDYHFENDLKKSVISPRRINNEKEKRKRKEAEINRNEKKSMDFVPLESMDINKENRLYSPEYDSKTNKIQRNIQKEDIQERDEVDVTCKSLIKSRKDMFHSKGSISSSKTLSDNDSIPEVLEQNEFRTNLLGRDFRDEDFSSPQNLSSTLQIINNESHRTSLDGGDSSSNDLNNQKIEHFKKKNKRKENITLKQIKKDECDFNPKDILENNHDTKDKKENELEFYKTFSKRSSENYDEYSYNEKDGERYDSKDNSLTNAEYVSLKGYGTSSDEIIDRDDYHREKYSGKDFKRTEDKEKRPFYGSSRKMSDPLVTDERTRYKQKTSPYNDFSKMKRSTSEHLKTHLVTPGSRKANQNLYRTKQDGIFHPNPTSQIMVKDVHGGYQSKRRNSDSYSYSDSFKKITDSRNGGGYKQTKPETKLETLRWLDPLNTSHRKYDEKDIKKAKEKNKPTIMKGRTKTDSTKKESNGRTMNAEIKIKNPLMNDIKEYMIQGARKDTWSPSKYSYTRELQSPHNRRLSPKRNDPKLQNYENLSFSPPYGIKDDFNKVGKVNSQKLTESYKTSRPISPKKDRSISIRRFNSLDNLHRNDGIELQVSKILEKITNVEQTLSARNEDVPAYLKMPNPLLSRNEKKTPSVLEKRIHSLEQRLVWLKNDLKEFQTSERISNLKTETAVKSQCRNIERELQLLYESIHKIRGGS